MKNLTAYVDACIAELHNVEIYPNYIASWKVNTRAASRWGLCSYRPRDKRYSIQIASVLLEDNAPENALKETILHELIHAVDGCLDHGEKWTRLVMKVNRAYGYNIQACDSYEEKGFTENPFASHYKYTIKCQECDREWNYMRMCKIITACEQGRVKCPYCNRYSMKLIQLR